MSTRDQKIDIPVGADERVEGTLVKPAVLVPAVLFVHGWGGSQSQYIARAREIAGLGCVCLTFDLRGHARDQSRHELVNRDDNLADVIAAYDTLVRQPGTDPENVAVVGSSYGGYLATILTELRPVRWLALRAPALYKDEDWCKPKRGLDRKALAAYRMSTIEPDSNRALRACTRFEGDALIIESEHDDMVPHPVIKNYMGAFMRARSLTYRVIRGADHGLSDDRAQQAYTSILVNWASEMVLGAREGRAAALEAVSRGRTSTPERESPTKGRSTALATS